MRCSRLKGSVRTLGDCCSVRCLLLNDHITDALCHHDYRNVGVGARNGWRGDEWHTLRVRSLTTQSEGRVTASGSFVRPPRHVPTGWASSTSRLSNPNARFRLSRCTASHRGADELRGRHCVARFQLAKFRRTPTDGVPEYIRVRIVRPTILLHVLMRFSISDVLKGRAHLTRPLLVHIHINGSIRGLSRGLSQGE